MTGKERMLKTVLLCDQPAEIHAQARAKTAAAKLKFAELAAAGADFIHVVNDEYHRLCQERAQP